MSTKASHSSRSKRPRRPKKPIEPIHVDELLAGAGMSGFLGVLNRPEKLARVDAGEKPRSARYASAEMSARVASVVSKVQALTELIKAKAKSQGD